MTMDPVAHFSEKLKPEIEFKDVGEDNGEMKLLHTLDDTNPDTIQDDVMVIMSAFVDTFSSYEEIRSLKLFLSSPNGRGFQVCRCKEEWARKSADAAAPLDDLDSVDDADEETRQNVLEAHSEAVTKTLESGDSYFTHTDKAGKTHFHPVEQ